MSEKTSFEIFNSSDSEMEIIHEPESFIFNLPVNEKIIIETDSCKEDIQLKVSSDNGKIVIAIWDGHGSYRVLHNDQNVFSEYL